MRAITQHMLKQAALMWWDRRDTLTIARKIQRTEAEVIHHLHRIRAVAELFDSLKEPRMRHRRYGPFYEWNDENISRLTDLWKAGTTTAKIAEALGCTPNSVIGKAQRLGLSKSNPKKAGQRGGKGATIGSAIANADRHRVKPPISLATIREALAEPEEGIDFNHEPPSHTQPVAFADLHPRHCRKPLWPDQSRPPLDQRFFCGGKAPETSSYCDECRPRLSMPMPGRTGKPFHSTSTAHSRSHS